MQHNKYICLYVMLGMFFSARLLHADVCDDIFNRARGRVESAKEAYNQKNYSLASQLCKEAAWYYEQVVSTNNCRCPKIVRLSQDRATYLRALADQYDRYVNDKKDYEQGKRQRADTSRTSVSSPVTVEASSPAVVYDYYDPGRFKPPDINQDMQGCTSYKFECSTYCTFKYTNTSGGDGYILNLFITTVLMKLSLPVTITLPRNPQNKLKAHEDGHRKICEYIYRSASLIAQRVGAKIIGQKFTGAGWDFEAAKQEALDLAGAAVQSEYLKGTQEVAEKANKYYDMLTIHGNNDVDSSKAVDETIKYYAILKP